MRGEQMKKLFILLSFFLPLSLLLAGCGEKEVKEGDTKNHLTVYTTVYPLQFFAEEIGGDSVEVNSIYPPGSDEHTFDPSQKDMMKLADADFFFYVGLGLEGFVEKAKSALKNENVKMIAVGESIDLGEQTTEHAEETSHDHDEDESDGHAHGDIDPHVWLDPTYAKEMALSIKNALVEKVPSKEEEFVNNYEELAQRLDELDAQFAKTINGAENKEIIVAHAAYGYWESRYGLEQTSISGLSSSSEPSQKELETIVATAKEQNIKYIFFEQNVNSKLTETVQKEIGAQPLTLHNLGVLTTEDINNKHDYFTIMNQNLEALKKALQ